LYKFIHTNSKQKGPTMFTSGTTSPHTQGALSSNNNSESPPKSKPSRTRNQPFGSPLLAPAQHLSEFTNESTGNDNLTQLHSKPTRQGNFSQESMSRYESRLELKEPCQNLNSGEGSSSTVDSNTSAFKFKRARMNNFKNSADRNPGVSQNQPYAPQYQDPFSSIDFVAGVDSEANLNSTVSASASSSNTTQPTAGYESPVQEQQDFSAASYGSPVQMSSSSNTKTQVAPPKTLKYFKKEISYQENDRVINSYTNNNRVNYEPTVDIKTLTEGFHSHIFSLANNHVVKVLKTQLYGNSLIQMLDKEINAMESAFSNFPVVPIEMVTIPTEKIDHLDSVMFTGTEIHPVIIQQKGDTFESHISNLPTHEEKQFALDSLFEKLFECVLEKIETGEVYGYDLAPKNTIMYTDQNGESDWAVCDFGLEDDDEPASAGIHVITTLNIDWKDVNKELKEHTCLKLLLKAKEYIENSTDETKIARVKEYFRGFSSSASSNSTLLIDKTTGRGKELCDYFNPPYIPNTISMQSQSSHQYSMSMFSNWDK
jgi:hypothetical protein